MGEENKNTSRKIHLFGRTLELPQSRVLRLVIGCLLIFGGFLGFLPVLGFWMLPLGFYVLSHDLALVRRLRRKFSVRFTRWRESRRK